MIYHDVGYPRPCADPHPPSAAGPKGGQRYGLPEVLHVLLRQVLWSREGRAQAGEDQLCGKHSQEEGS